MSIKECIAMILAGGRGERLGALTRYYSKPAVHFGGKSRIIDFTLCNCIDSGIGAIGILSQYCSEDLGEYIETAYGRHSKDNKIYMLPPRRCTDYYSGTADAVYKNIRFMKRFGPKCVLVLAGDHIYNMDYKRMIKFHMDSGADITVASTVVPMREASRFGILSADEKGQITDFEEKPEYPRSRLASMGIYVFNWNMLIKYLHRDSEDELSQHDFGRNILPAMLQAGELMYTYQFNGYWRDVGTVDSLWEANMDQIDRPSDLLVRSGRQEITGSEASENFSGSWASSVNKSIISADCSIFGKVEHSILSDGVEVGYGAEIIDSVIMPGAYIGNNTRIYKTVVGTNAAVMDGSVIGGDSGSNLFLNPRICANGVSLVAPWIYVEERLKFKTGSNICEERLQEFIAREINAPCENTAAGYYRSGVEF